MTSESSTLSDRPVTPTMTHEQKITSLWKIIATLTYERDEARREVCNLRALNDALNGMGSKTVTEVAASKCWDCYSGYYSGYGAEGK